MKLTAPLERVLLVFLADLSARRYGYDLMKAAKLASGTLYPMLARLEEKLGARNKAEAEFKAAIETSGNLAHYWVDLAGFYRRSGRLNDMESTVNKARDARLDNGIGLFDAATLLLQAGRNFPAASRSNSRSR